MSESGPAPPEELGEAFEQWLDAQRQAVALVVSAPQPGHPVDWAEGYRWVTRIASLAQDWVIEHADPLRPELFLSQGPTRKLIVDNPDVDYRFASLDPGERYRISGRRGGAAAIGLSVGTDVLRGASGRTGTLGQYQLDDFALEPDGRFEIALSRDRQPGNWIALPEGAAQIAVRETFRDRRREAPTAWRIERVGAPLAPRDLSPEVAAERIRTAARFLLFVARTCVAMWQGNAGSVNQIRGALGAQHAAAQEDEVRTHSATDMAYQGGRWKLAPGEALELTIREPAGGGPYWGITLVSPWMESYEYRERRVATNNGLATRGADGAWRVVIAAEDPGVPNWLDTGGRPEGFALIRWVLPAALPPNPECRVVPVASLSAGAREA